ncbi:tetratricopeptide repeat protein [bacterium]|nr:tetratricopeptide repeat protein [bacterium]
MGVEFKFQSESIINNPKRFAYLMRILSKVIRLLPFASLFLLLTALSFRLIAENDLGFHLHGGEWILQNRAFPTFDSYTYTVPNHLYIDLHWLYQILLYTVYVWIGFEGISAVYVTLILIVFTLMYYWFKSNQITSSATLWLMLGVLLTIEVRFNFRPEIMTWVWMILMLFVLDHYVRERRRVLWILPVIMVLWTNTQGLFVIGLLIMGAYAVSVPFQEKKIDRYLWMWSFFGMASILINPYFVDGAMFPVELATRLDSGSIFKNTILEFISPWSSFARSRPALFPPQVIALYYLFTFLSGVLVIVTIRNRKIHELVIAVALFAVSYSQYRNIPLFVIYASGLTGQMLNEVWFWFQKKRTMTSISGILRYSQCLLVFVTLSLSLRVVTDSYYISDKRLIRFGWGLDSQFVAERAFQFMEKHAINRRFLNNISIGNWLGWRLNQRVFIDGRLEVMKEKLYTEYQNSFNNGGLRLLVDRYLPQLIVFNYASAMSWQNQLRDMPSWRIIYWDYNTAIYAHNSYLLQLPPIRFSEELLKMGYDTVLTDISYLDAWIGPPKSSTRIWLSGFFVKQKFPVPLLHMALFAESSGALNEAEILYLEFIRESRGRIWEVFYNLGMLYYRQNSWENALDCFERYRFYKPTDPKIIQLIFDCQQKSKRN